MENGRILEPIDVGVGSSFVFPVEGGGDRAKFYVFRRIEIAFSLASCGVGLSRLCSVNFCYWKDIMGTLFCC